MLTQTMLKSAYRISILFIVAVFSVQLTGCGVYSFTGASISPNIKTAEISAFPNQSSGGPGNLGQVFSESLREKLLRETNLTLTAQSPDIQFSGAIVSYNVQGMSPTANQTTALNRLSITVRVEFVNFQNEKENWNQNFTRFADFEATQSLSSVEDQLIQEINQRIVDDIFNRAFVNW